MHLRRKEPCYRLGLFDSDTSFQPIFLVYTTTRRFSEFPSWLGLDFIKQNEKVLAFNTPIVAWNLS